MQRVLAFVFVLVLCVPSGCGQQRFERPNLEDLGLVTILGFDYREHDVMRVIASVPQPSQQAEQKTQIYTADARIPHEALMAISTKSEKTITPYQLRVILFSEEYARKRGIHDALLSLYRDPRIGDNVFIGIVKGSVEKLMSGKYENKPELGTFLNDLMRPRRETAFQTNTTMHDIIFQTTSTTYDPMLPYLEKREGDVQITKAALIRDGKMVDTLPTRKGKIVVALKGMQKLPDMILDLPSRGRGAGKAKAVLSYVSAKQMVKVKDGTEEPAFKLFLYLDCNLVDYTGSRKLEIPGEFLALQKEIERELEKIALVTLTHLQKLGVDPVGLREGLRATYPGEWSLEKGREMMKRATFDVDIQLEMIRFGTISGRK